MVPSLALLCFSRRNRTFETTRKQVEGRIGCTQFLKESYLITEGSLLHSLEEYIGTFAYAPTSYKLMPIVGYTLHAQPAPAQASRAEASCLVQHAGYKIFCSYRNPNI